MLQILAISHFFGRIANNINSDAKINKRPDIKLKF